MTIKKVTTVLLVLMVGGLVSGGAYMLSRPEEGPRVQPQLSISQAFNRTGYADFARVLMARELDGPCSSARTYFTQLLMGHLCVTV